MQRMNQKLKLNRSSNWYRNFMPVVKSLVTPEGIARIMFQRQNKAIELLNRCVRIGDFQDTYCVCIRALKVLPSCKGFHVGTPHVLVLASSILRKRTCKQIVSIPRKRKPAETQPLNISCIQPNGSKRSITTP